VSQLSKEDQAKASRQVYIAGLSDEDAEKIAMSNDVEQYNPNTDSRVPIVDMTMNIERADPAKGFSMPTRKSPVEEYNAPIQRIDASVEPLTKGKVRQVD
jgi:hypothetical protein